MKELEIKTEDNVHIVDEQKKTKVLFDNQIRNRSHILFEYNNVTNRLTRATYKPASVMITGSLNGAESVTTYVCDVNDDCIYFQALNQKNAERKLGKYGLPIRQDL